MIFHSSVNVYQRVRISTSNFSLAPSIRPGEVSQHLERITVAVLSQELLTKSALEMALLPILQGTWEEAPAGTGTPWRWRTGCGEEGKMMGNDRKMMGNDGK